MLAKGLSGFDLLREADLSLVMSHADPAPRGSLMGMAPIDVFLAAYGDDGRELPGALGVEKVGPRELPLRPSPVDAGRRARVEREVGL